jgi:hypothetical protein
MAGNGYDSRDYQNNSTFLRSYPDSYRVAIHFFRPSTLFISHSSFFGRSANA